MAQMGRPKVDKPKDVRVAFRVTKEEYEMLTDYAEKNDLSVSEVLYMGMIKILHAKRKH